MRTSILSLIIVGLVGIAPCAGASDWDLVLNGKSLHLGAEKDWNEDNWGLGIEREFNSNGRWVKVAVANAFRDSGDEMAYMAGGGIKRRFRLFSEALYADVGLVGFVMTRHDINGNRPFPGILPVVTLGTRNVALNVTYLPQSAVGSVVDGKLRDPDMSGVLFFQLKVDARLFGPRRSGPWLASAPTSQ